MRWMTSYRPSNFFAETKAAVMDLGPVHTRNKTHGRTERHSRRKTLYRIDSRTTPGHCRYCWEILAPSWRNALQTPLRRHTHLQFSRWIPCLESDLRAVQPSTRGLRDQEIQSIHLVLSLKTSWSTTLYRKKAMSHPTNVWGNLLFFIHLLTQNYEINAATQCGEEGACFSGSACTFTPRGAVPALPNFGGSFLFISRVSAMTPYLSQSLPKPPKLWELLRTSTRYDRHRPNFARWSNYAREKNWRLKN